MIHVRIGFSVTTTCGAQNGPVNYPKLRGRKATSQRPNVARKR